MDNEALQLRVNILFFINSLKASGLWEPTWDSKVFNFNSDSLLGSFAINNPIGNAEILDYNMASVVDVVRTEENHFNACVVDLPLSSFNLTIKYVADIAVKNILPIYGDGSILTGLNDSYLTMCWILDESQSYVMDMDINITTRHGPALLTGFYDNEALDAELSDALFRAQRYVAMWATYEPECSRTCLTNEVVKFLVNYLKYDRNDGLSLDCDCLKELHDGLSKELRSCSDTSFFGMFFERLINVISQ